MKDNTYLYYAGNMVCKNDKSLNYLLFDEGLVTKISLVYSYEYHLKDHLGNTQVTFQPNNSTTTTTQVAEYYPFSSSYLPISPTGTNKYHHNGKEKQDDVLSGTALDWYDYGARFYDPMIGRWHSVDTLCELGRRFTPYNYAFNNPLRYTDPDEKWTKACSDISGFWLDFGDDDSAKKKKEKRKKKKKKSNKHQIVNKLQLFLLIIRKLLQTTILMIRKIKMMMLNLLG